MGFSARENDSFIQKFVKDYGILSVLDVGAGSGTYSNLLSWDVEYLDAIEVWEPSIGQFSLDKKYRKIFNVDVRDQKAWQPDEDYDLTIFGDVLEHMSVMEAEEVFAYAKTFSRYVMVSVPIIHYPQDAYNGNPFEVHVIEDAMDELIPLLSPLIMERQWNITGTFIYRGEIELW